MRTTITLDDDTHEFVTYYARSRGLSLGAAIDELIQKGQTASPAPPAGFLRVTTNPAFHPGPRTLEEAITILQVLKGLPGYWFCQIDESWVTLTARFASRIFGHQHVTDAYLLGLAVKEGGKLVTFDRGIKYMAWAEFSRNVLLLDSSQA